MLNNKAIAAVFFTIKKPCVVKLSERTERVGVRVPRRPGAHALRLMTGLVAYLRRVPKCLSIGLAACMGVTLCTNLLADWPQYQGPGRDNHSTETGLLKQWPEAGPPLAWTFRQSGLGYSSPAIVGDRLFITGARQEQEHLIAIDTSSGQELWAVPIGPVFDFSGNAWGPGPRSAPTVAGSRVFALGGRGNLVAVDTQSGQVVWSKHMMQDLAGEVNPIGGGPGTKPGEEKIGWGYSWAPLVDGDRLICFPGGPQGALTALNFVDGQLVWRSTSLTVQASYASPIAAEIEGVLQYVVLHNTGLSGVSAADGSLLWQWDKSYPDVVIPTPLLHDGQIYVSAGSNPSTCGLIQISKQDNQFSAQQKYSSKATRVMKNQVGGSVIVSGHAYGYSDKIGWVCQEVATGNQKWAARNPLKAGSVISAEGLLYCYDEDNAVVALVVADSEKFQLASSFKIPEQTAHRAPSGRNWTPPVIANGHLYIRDQELLFCYKIKR